MSRRVRTSFTKRLILVFQVEAIVVFMPTDSGSAIINNVYWPGNIPAMTINQALDYIIRCTSANANTDHRVLMDIASLLK